MLASFVRMLVAVCAIVPVFAASAQERQPAPVAVEDYTVFVDPPSALAFIKLPAGWKFIGKLDADQMRHLPPGTVTSLLPPGDADLAEDTQELPD